MPSYSNKFKKQKVRKVVFTTDNIVALTFKKYELSQLQRAQSLSSLCLVPEGARTFAGCLKS